MLGCLLGAEPAWADDDQLRLEGEDLIPACRERRPAGSAQHVDAARKLDHLRQPVPRAERRLEPLGEEDAPPRAVPHRAGHFLRGRSHTLRDPPALPRDAEWTG